MDQSLASVMRNINDALRLDDDSHDKEAYVKYLDCVLCITCSLQQAIQQTGGDVVITKQITKQVKLAQQCIERVSVLVEKIGFSQKPVVVKSPPDDLTMAVKSKPFVAVPPLPSEPPAHAFARAKGKTPMEIAFKQNQQLMAAYRARMKRMNKRDPGAFNLSLTIQRKMAENLAIAKKTEMALAKKMQERQDRLEEQAAKRFSTPIGMSEEEQEQRQIYKKILEYEQDAKWLQNWRSKLEASPEEPELICQLIQDILRCQDHPLTLLLKQYQYKIYEKIYPLVSSKKQRLEVVRVPLDRSLWPLELCNDEAATSLNLSLPPKFRDADTVDEDEGIQSDQDSLAKQGEDSAGSEENKDEDNESVSETVTTVCEQSCDSSDTPCDPKPSTLLSQDSCQEKDKPVDRACTGNDIADSPSLLDKEEPMTLLPDNLDEYVENLKDVNEDKGCTSVSTEVCDEAADAPDSHPESDSDPKKVPQKVTGESDQAANSGEESDMSSQLPEENTQEAAHSEDLDENPVLRLTEDTKEEVSEAMAKGEQQQALLKYEQERTARVLRQISQDYEKYNAENMDDLFDSDDEEGAFPQSSEADHSKDPEANQATSSSIPASLTSQTSQSSPDSLVSRSSSGGSVQDFPSLPSVECDETTEEIERMSKEAYQRHLKNISADVHMYMEKLLILFTIAYEHLDCPSGRDQCYASLEETFFKPLWKFLLMLFRLTNYKDEITVACKMTQKADMSPRDIGVTSKLCLLPSPMTDASAEEGDFHPYQQAIQQLVCIKDHYTMLSKLECIVKVVHLIFDSIKEFYIKQGYQPDDVPSVGADDLLPVMSYVVMRSHLPQLVSECHAMAEFVHEGYIMGQEGYCLTTLETAVSFIVSSDLNQPFTPT